MKKKTRFQRKLIAFWVIISVMVSQGVYAQTDLVINNGVAIIESAGNYNIPANGISPIGQNTNKFRLDVVVEKASPSAVKIGTDLLTNISRSYPNGYGGNIGEVYADVHLPGAYTISGDEGNAQYDVRYISDPYLTVGSVTKHLSEWGSTIAVPDGESVGLALESWFSTTGSNRFYTDGTLLPSAGNYILTGNGSVVYKLQTRDGYGANPTYEIVFTLNFQTSATVPVSSVTLNKTSTSLTVGETETLAVTVNPSNATDRTVGWSSSNTSVAIVDANGKVTAVSAGTATITVKTTDGNKTASCTVTVSAGSVVATGVTLDQTSLTKTVGDAPVTLTATVTPANATDKTVFWRSSNTAVATVTGGVVNFVGAGTATIAAIIGDGSKEATCVVTVNSTTVAVTGVTLNKTSTVLPVGGTETLTAIINPANATNPAVNWISYNTEIATVDATGKITAVAAGSTTITATTVDGSKTAACAVTVSGSGGSIVATGVTLDQTSLIKTVGDPAVTLTATVTPANATDQTVFWRSSNTAVATVTGGVVTFVGAGTATITVIIADGSKEATCEVTVNPATAAVKGVMLNKSSLTLAVGGNESLVSTVTPSNAANKEVVWSTSDASVVSIVNEKLTAVKEGTATITVETLDGHFTAACVVTVVSGAVPEPEEYTISITSNAGGVVTPTGKQKIKAGENLFISVTPNQGYAIDKITLDGVEHPVTEIIAIMDIQKDYTLNVIFKYDPVSIEAVENLSLKIYTPQSGMLKIGSSNEVINRVDIYSLSGAIMNSVQVNATEAIINNLPKGIS